MRLCCWSKSSTSLAFFFSFFFRVMALFSFKGGERGPFILHLKNQGVTTPWLLPYPVYLRVNKSRPPPPPPSPSPPRLPSTNKAQATESCCLCVLAWPWPSALNTKWSSLQRGCIRQPRTVTTTTIPSKKFHISQ